MNIFIQEMKMSFKSRLSWLIGLIAVLALFMSMFPAIQKESGMLNSILEKFPEALVKALGLASFDLGSILGFYGFLFIYLTVIGSIFAMKMGLGIISEEIRVKTSDFLLTKPVSRLTILSWKGLCALANIFIVSLVFCTIAFVVCRNIEGGSIDNKVFVLISLSFFLVQLFFVTFGMLMGSFSKKVKAVLPPSMGVVFGFYAIQFFSQSFPEAHLSYFTPFAYFDIVKIIGNKAFDMKYLLLDLALALIFTGLAFAKYIKKDMPSV